MVLLIFIFKKREELEFRKSIIKGNVQEWFVGNANFIIFVVVGYIKFKKGKIFSLNFVNSAQKSGEL